MMRHFLDDDDLSRGELLALIERSVEMKTELRQGKRPDILKNKVLGMIFSKASTRTRTSFEAGMAQMGGHAINLTPNDTQLGRGEPLTDTAKVLSEMVDAVMIRNDSQTDQIEFAANASVPVINGLSDLLHPCQMLADVQTIIELRGAIEGTKVAWIGDGCNMCNSWIKIAAKMGCELTIACPEGYDPNPKILTTAQKLAPGKIQIVRNPEEAAQNADVVMTDVWASMGQESEAQARMKAFSGYCVDDALMKRAHQDAIFLHCLPAHRGEEVSASVIDGEQSVVWQQAGNRLHAQKALLELLLT